MVAPLAAAATRMAAKKVVQKKATSKTGKRMAGRAVDYGVTKANKTLKSDKQKHQQEQTDQSNWKASKITKTSQRPTAKKIRPQANLAPVIGEDIKPKQDTNQVVSKIKNRAMWSWIWPIYLISFLQFVFGILTWIAYGFWITLDSWTWGLSNYVVDNDSLFGGLWFITMVLGLISLVATALVFMTIGKKRIFSNPVTFFLFIGLVCLAIFPFTSFLPSAVLLSAAVAVVKPNQ